MQGPEIKKVFWTTVGLSVVIGGAAILASSGEKSPETQEALDVPPAGSLPSIPPESLEDIPPQPFSDEEWNCAPIPKGSWLTQELRNRGEPGIDPPPYRLIRKNGNVKEYSEYSQLPSLVYPGEIFCIYKKDSGQSFLEPGRNHGTVYEAVKNQNKQLAFKSEGIVASLKAQQGF